VTGPPVVLETPDERFENLPGWPWPPRYVGLAGMRMHYVDAGPRYGQAVLLLHGEPTWSFLYRGIIPPIAAAGFRVIAPDFIGFGRSDKLATQADYSYAFHVETLAQLLAALGLDDLTLVAHDWGGLIGLRVLAAEPGRFARVLLANTGLPTATLPPPAAFFEWRDWSQRVPDFRAGRVVRAGCLRPIPAAVEAAYDAPFPDERFKAGARAFPMLVPVRDDDPAQAANETAWEVLASWTRPLLTAFSDSDPLTRGGDRVFQERIPGARGQPHVTIAGAGHFLQEDRGDELARIILAFARSR
jgi:haloalkane dehalogenase